MPTQKAKQGKYQYKTTNEPNKINTSVTLQSVEELNLTNLGSILKSL